MFFGCIPIATRISCIPFMLNHGKRGVIIEPNVENAVNNIDKYLKNNDDLKVMSKLASKWAQNYTLDVFETAISKFLN
jgi:glycosyltransferase involved in cell wall biosynthesis